MYVYSPLASEWGTLRVVQCDAGCCRVMQYDTVCCSMMQSVAVCCQWWVLKFHSLPLNEEQCTCCSLLRCDQQSVAVWYSLLQCGAVCCSVMQSVTFGLEIQLSASKWETVRVLQNDAVCCSVMQCDVVFCSALQWASQHSFAALIYSG